MLEDLIKERLKKKDALEKLGLNVYPARVKRSHLVAHAVKDFAALSKKKTKVWLTGRLLGLRVQGGVAFADLADGSGAKIQIVLAKAKLPNFQALKDNLDIGDFVEVSGPLFKTKKGERSIEAKTLRVIVKSVRPLPSVWHGLSDIEERFRKRYLDLLLNADVKSKLQKRSQIVQDIRNSLTLEGFLEVETPSLQAIPGGAKARPFKTHHNALDVDFYLRIAPELYLKRLLIGGMERVFEIGKSFRNEGIDRDHNPEFTSLELYWAYQDYTGLMKFTQKLLKKFIPGKWSMVKFADIFKKHSGKDYKQVNASDLDEVFKKEVRPKIVEPTFVIDYPESLMALAKLHEKDRSLTESFQLIVNGVEIVKGFSELNDPVFQRDQMERQEKDFRAGDEESSRKDEDFLEALEYGMPPSAGLGIGIDRLVAIVTKAHAVKEIILFPTLRPK
ncbi:MAG: lysyl-tRNA synthetase, class II [Parcubacteria group bacterium Gr01-1014_19]|nr:MAG: lysyl-tRNA synthetase, class II [Parcubacteria group bacterium Gr01-1014_19]